MVLWLARHLPWASQFLLQFYVRAIRFLGGSRSLAITFFGAQIRGDLRDFIMQRIYLFGIWEPQVSLLIGRLLQPGDTFIDVGANIGYHSLLANHAMGRNGTLVAIEPSPNIRAHLQEHFALNRVQGARIVGLAVGSVQARVDFFAGEATNQGRSSTVARPGLTRCGQVEMQPLQTILSAAERSRARLIKIDVEGGELPILQELLEHIDQYHPDLKILVELSHTGPEVDSLFKSYLEAGFRAFRVENDYSFAGYLRPMTFQVPQPLARMPEGQIDLLLSRGKLDAEMETVA